MKKKIISVCLALALVAATAAGTLAYFTDSDSAVNVLTAGNVKIVQNERDRFGSDVVFAEDEIVDLVPAVYGPANGGKSAWDGGADKNYVDKIVTVSNAGRNSAYVHTFIALPKALDDPESAAENALHWNAGSSTDWFWCAKYPSGAQWPGNGGDWGSFTLTIDGMEYIVYCATYTSVLNPGETTPETLKGVYLDNRVTCGEAADGSITYMMNGADISSALLGLRVLTATQAVQADGFENAGAAFAAAFGEPEAQTAESLGW